MFRKGKIMEIKCNKCGKIFKPGNADGLPNGVGFEMKDGTVINVCRECLSSVGMMNEEERDRFFKELLEGGK